METFKRIKNGRIFVFGRFVRLERIKNLRLRSIITQSRMNGHHQKGGSGYTKHSDSHKQYSDHRDHTEHSERYTDNWDLSYGEGVFVAVAKENPTSD